MSSTSQQRMYVYLATHICKKIFLERATETGGSGFPWRGEGQGGGVSCLEVDLDLTVGSVVFVLSSWIYIHTHTHTHIHTYIHTFKCPAWRGTGSGSVSSSHFASWQEAGLPRGLKAVESHRPRTRSSVTLAESLNLSESQTPHLHNGNGDHPYLRVVARMKRDGTWQAEGLPDRVRNSFYYPCHWILYNIITSPPLTTSPVFPGEAHTDSSPSETGMTVSPGGHVVNCTR